MFSRILVPLDGSPLAQAVLAMATTIALAEGATLTLLAVSDSKFKGDKGMSADDLEFVAGQLGAHDIAVEVRTARGEPGPTIVDIAKEEGFDLIAMCTHGRTGLSRMIRGSVSDYVLHHTDTPLLMMRPAAVGTDQEEERVPFELKEVLVPLDGSPAGEMALPYGAHLARTMGVPLHLVRVATVIAYPADASMVAGMGAYTKETAALEQQVYDMAARYLEEVKAQPVLSRVSVKASTRWGTPGHVITEIAEATPGTLVVLTTHARSGIARTVLGSVTETIVRNSHAPTLVLGPAMVEQAAQTKTEGKPIAK